MDKLHGTAKLFWINNFLFLLFGLIGCDNKGQVKDRNNLLVDSIRINTSRTLYIYKTVSPILSSRSTENYFCVGRNMCEVLDSSKTVGFVLGYMHIDSGNVKKIFITASGKFHLYKDTTGLNLVFRESNLQEKILEPKMGKSIFVEDYCK